MSALYRNRPTANFTTIRNGMLRDTRIGLKAKGLLALMLSFPPDWTYRQSHIQSLSTDGRDAVRTGIRELEAAGYITRERVRNDDGTLADTEYAVSDEVTTCDGLSNVGKSNVGKPDTTKTYLTKTEFTKMGEEYQFTETPAEPAIPPPPTSDHYSSEEAFLIKATTGVDPTTREHQVRDRIRLAAGAPFTTEHADRIPSWSREHTPDAIDGLWTASRPDLWKGTAKESKRRAWIFLDLLNQDIQPKAARITDDGMQSGALIRTPDGETRAVQLVTSGFLILEDGQRIPRATAMRVPS